MISLCSCLADFMVMDAAEHIAESFFGVDIVVFSPWLERAIGVPIASLYDAVGGDFKGEGLRLLARLFQSIFITPHQPHAVTAAWGWWGFKRRQPFDYVLTGFYGRRVKVCDT